MAGAALVTGGARRIGRAIALALAARGMAVAIHHNRSGAEAEATAADARALGVDATVVQADLADADAVRSILPEAARGLGQPIDVLVNNASLFERDSVRDVTVAGFDAHMAINLRAPLLLAQDFAAALPDDRPGNIVNLIDQRVWKPTPGFMSYTLSKSALLTLTQTLAMALAPRIRVNGIGPGPVLPNERQTQAQFDRQWRSTLLQRGAEPEEIADAVLFLLASRSITGQMIALDGGQFLPWPPLSQSVADLDG
ncbi:MAG: SDR family oxidoreductase [Pseudomonadota bacterium]|nr:SDR family oxidoreductase [Pseudomonadota bacterium]